MTAWWVVCDGYTCGPFKTQAAAEVRAGSITECRQPHSVAVGDLCRCGHLDLRHMADQGPCYDCGCERVR